MNDVTLIISTFERPDALRACLTSIRKFYGDLPILIADDSSEALKMARKNVKYYKLPFDMGLSYKRNFLVRLVETKYVIILDDDFIFTEDTNLERLRENIEKHDLDILAGGVTNKDKHLHYYRGLFEIEDNILYYREGDKGMVGDVTLYDLVLNFFISKTEFLRENPWDNRLKIAEHTPFFLSIKDKARVGYIDGVVVENSRAEYSGNYNRFRKRASDFTHIWMSEFDIEKTISFDGREFINPAHPKNLKKNPYGEIHLAAKQNQASRGIRV